MMPYWNKNVQMTDYCLDNLLCRLHISQGWLRKPEVRHQHCGGSNWSVKKGEVVRLVVAFFFVPP